MELQNKKIAFLGDSITEGIGVSHPEQVYWKLLEKSGALCYGYGISGTRIAVQNHPSEDLTWDKNFSSRIDKMLPDADIVVIFGGTNDFGHGDAPFGSLQDRTEDTFCGAMHILLQKIIQRYPKAQIITMTPLHRLSESQRGFNGRGIRQDHTLEEYVDAIITISGYYGVPVLDTYRVSGLQPALPIIQEMYMPDGLHPNDFGHKRIAEKLLNFLITI